MSGLSIPVEIWNHIAHFVPESPIHYLRLAGISRSSRAAFLSDNLWANINVAGSSVGIAEKFVSRVLGYNRLLQAIVYEGWKWIELPAPRPKFEALGFCLIQDGSGLVTLSIKIDSLHYCHNLANNPDVKLMVALKVLSDLEIDNRLFDPFTPVELMIMDSVDTSDVAFMSVLCRYSRRACAMPAQNLRMDPQFVMQLLRNTGEFIGEGPMLQNRDFALAAVKITPKALHRLEDFLDDDEIVWLACSKAPTTLSIASQRLSDNRELVLACVHEDGDALEYASDRLKSDKEVVLTAVNQNGHAIEFSSESLLDDDQVKQVALENSAYIYQVCDEVPCHDRNMALVAVKHNPTNIQWLAPELQKDGEILQLAKQNDVENVLPGMGF